MERSRSCPEKSSINNIHARGVIELRRYNSSYVTSKKVTGAAWPSPAASSPSSSSAATGSKTKMWGGGFGGTAPAELRRTRRLAGYRVYGVEGKMKVSLKKGVRWLKRKCNKVVDGLW